MIRRAMDDYEASEHQDRLSDLPNTLILLILSFLPMREVVSTTILSKRWKNLWTGVPCLNFCETISKDSDGAERFRVFVTTALVLWEGTKIMKFEIDTYFNEILAGDMDWWLHFAVKHKVEELNIRLTYDNMDWDDAFGCINRDVYTAPRCLNTCTSIKKLSLVGCNLRIYEPPTWDQLESLTIDGFCFSERVINQILWGSPRIEVFELRLLECFENLNIWSRSLKKLRIEKYLFFDSDELSRNTALRICCPNLETLEISGCFYSKYLLTDVSSVTDVTLGFGDTIHYQLLGEALRQILPAIQHVENIALSIYFAEVLGESLRGKMLPLLPNVKCLKLTDDSFGDIEYEDVMNVLVICPNIKMLVIEDDTILTYNDPLQFEANLPNSFLMQLKTIQIKSPLLSSSIWWMMEFLLSHASMLEKLVILPDPAMGYSQNFLFKFARKLSTLPRSSPTAKVIMRRGYHIDDLLIQ